MVVLKSQLTAEREERKAAQADDAADSAKIEDRTAHDRCSCLISLAYDKYVTYRAVLAGERQKETINERAAQ